ncbi:MAG: TIGR02206 family membrane protein [Bryobacteraceae bacterium]|jgi:hypothetical integral membrane protein (TIGR02206 family)
MNLPIHILLLAAIAAIAILLCGLCRRNSARARQVRMLLGYGIAINELIWWVFRYWHEGIRASNLPLQLCDVTLWAAVIACLTPFPMLVEFLYFAGLAGAGMALLTPTLWSKWPSYPAIYFFVAHGGVVIAAAVLVFGRICPLRRNAMWRAFALLAGYTAVVGLFNALFRTNFMYLCQKPGGGSLLDFLGPWPVYLFGGAAAALVLFALLSIPVRRQSV